MCRFAAYLGDPIQINDVITRPRDSLIKQSGSARESDIKVNGDGFGIGWYNHAVTEIPAVLVSTLPAWNDINLIRIAHQITSACFFGHVRAAGSAGISLFNCHPFRYKDLLLMHNGGIAGNDQIKLELFNMMDEICFRWIQGHTDSEIMFALWLTFYSKETKDNAGKISAWEKTLTTIRTLQKKHNITDTTYINAIITNGYEFCGIRYSSNPKDMLSLHYSIGQQFVHSSDGYRMVPTPKGEKNKCVLLTSERLNSHNEDWRAIPPQHIFTVDRDKNIEFTGVSH